MSTEALRLPVYSPQRTYTDSIEDDHPYSNCPVLSSEKCAINSESVFSADSSLLSTTTTGSGSGSGTTASITHLVERRAQQQEAVGEGLEEDEQVNALTPTRDDFENHRDCSDEKTADIPSHCCSQYSSSIPLSFQTESKLSCPVHELYDYEDINDSTTDLTCSICQDTLREPVTLACLHHFCSVCLNKWIESKLTSNLVKAQVACPLCRAQFIDRNMVIKAMQLNHKETVTVSGSGYQAQNTLNNMQTTTWGNQMTNQQALANHTVTSLISSSSHTQHQPPTQPSTQPPTQPPTQPQTRSSVIRTHTTRFHPYAVSGSGSGSGRQMSIMPPSFPPTLGVGSSPSVSADLSRRHPFYPPFQLTTQVNKEVIQNLTNSLLASLKQCETIRTKNELIVQTLKDLSVSCVSCQCQLKQSQFASHVQQCTQVKYRCVYPDCQYEATKETFIAEHLHKCTTAYIRCEHCQHIILATHKYHHQVHDCQEAIAECPYSRNGCHMSVKRKFLQQHIQSPLCTRVVKCYSAQCSWRGTHDQLPRHYKYCIHNKKANAFFNRMFNIPYATVPIPRHVHTDADESDSALSLTTASSSSSSMDSTSMAELGSITDSTHVLSPFSHINEERFRPTNYYLQGLYHDN